MGKEELTEAGGLHHADSSPAEPIYFAVTCSTDLSNYTLRAPAHSCKDGCNYPSPATPAPSTETRVITSHPRTQGSRPFGTDLKCTKIIPNHAVGFVCQFPPTPSESTPPWDANFKTSLGKGREPKKISSLKSFKKRGGTQ